MENWGGAVKWKMPCISWKRHIFKPGIQKKFARERAYQCVLLFTKHICLPQSEGGGELLCGGGKGVSRNELGRRGRDGIMGEYQGAPGKPIWDLGIPGEKIEILEFHSV